MGGAPDNTAAIKLQQDSLAQNAVQNKALLAMMQQQVDQAKLLKLPKAAPPAPLPDTSSADMVAQSQEQTRNLLKRNGLLQTRLVQPLANPIRSAMGSPILSMPMAA